MSSGHKQGAAWAGRGGVARATIGQRIFAGACAALMLAVLIVSAWLRPEPAGHGTHEQLGLPSCGWLSMTGEPCPTCGMTTAFASLTHGDVAGAVRAQFFGATLALGSAVGFWGCVHIALFGSRLGVVGARLLRPRVVWVVIAVWMLSWVQQMLTWERT